MIWNTIAMAFSHIRRNGLRSVLTALGVVIGVAAVIAMVTLGQGTTVKVTSDIARLGRNMLIVAPGEARHGGSGPVSTIVPFKLDDANAIADGVPGLNAVAPTVGRSVLAVAGNRNWHTALTGSSNGWFVVRDWAVAEGRIFSDLEQRSGAPVCVLGKTVKDELFGGQDALGASLRVGKVACEVVGILASKGQSTFGDDQDDLVLVPLKLFQRRVAGTDDVAAISVSVGDVRPTVDVARDIEALMRQRRGLTENEDNNFVVRDVKEIQTLVESTTGILTTLLSAIAAVSLLVGGIGIMNIMLVSVTERTREIGVRLAIGALEQDVLMQFLVEAVVLSVMGGLIGVALGLSGSWVTARALHLPFTVDVTMTTIAVLFSVAVGVGFGYFPARKAARLNPIDALRYE